MDATLEDDTTSIRIDALKRANEASKLGNHHYLPVLYHHGDKVGCNQKLLMAALGLLLARVQGLRPAVGLVVRKPECQSGKVSLDAKLYRRAEQLMVELDQLHRGNEAPPLMLNKHCHLCEFRHKCRSVALEKDDISLLETVSEKELRKLNRKGLFTLTQLSCTFRPRKKSKRVKRPGEIRYSALQALAVREKKVHVFGTPNMPGGQVAVFLDAEGREDGFTYLLGVLVVEGDAETMHSFWADSPEQEAGAFDAFLDLLEAREEFVLFHYGSYEKRLLQRMRSVVKRKKLVDRLLAKAVNVLSVIHGNLYFPTFSNGLKEVGRYLGCAWTETNASGLQSLVWRAHWEQTREPSWKDKLLTYNAEDCAALRKIAEFIQVVGETARCRGERGATPPGGPGVVWADEITAQSSRREWCRAQFIIEDLDHVNRCAYFDYQRERVFVRTNRAIRRACLNTRKRRNRRRPPVTKEIEIKGNVCPDCKGTRITRLYNETHSKLAYDLKFTTTCIRRQVIRCTTARHRCDDCKVPFLPKRYKRLAKYQHGLKSWAMYQHIVHRISFEHLEVMIQDCFGLRIGFPELHMMKTLVARRYRLACKRILGRLVGGALIHSDETHANLQMDKGYVWALTNMEDVLYMYKPSREASFLQELLKDFKGVLVSDFYGGYDSLPCRQQKCLIHLIRDFNSDLMGNPYDEELKALAAEFGRLLRSIVVTIDTYGLKEYHLHKHKAEVERFFRAVELRTHRSEVAAGYQKRLIKNQNRLFTFLDCDGVPWNNNNAEHAVKNFAYYRRVSDGKMQAEGLSDYLVLLSIYQTCKYRGVSFLKFLLSGECDVEVFCERERRRRRPPLLEIYPAGFPPTHHRKTAAGETKSEAGMETLVSRCSISSEKTENQHAMAAASGIDAEADRTAERSR